MKFGIGVLYKNLSSQCEFNEKRLSEPHFRRAEVNSSTRTSCILQPICMTFGTGDIRLMSLSRYEFPQIHGVLKGVHEILSVFSTFLSDLDKTCYRRMHATVY